MSEKETTICIGGHIQFDKQTSDNAEVIAKEFLFFIREKYAIEGKILGEIEVDTYNNGDHANYFYCDDEDEFGFWKPITDA